MIFAARVDANQPDIVRALRGAGASVQLLHTVGAGCPDLLVGIDGANLLIEVKDGSKPPSKRVLTPDQTEWTEWHRTWCGQVTVANSIAEALIALKGSRR
ncbi:MAG: hypothetical protein JWM53_3351 [bacterium]|nr:hypothetical protein [bacterium]